jgi:flagellar motor switch protein FliM
MTNAVASQLSAEKIRQLLAAVRLEPGEDAAKNAELPMYDWCHPHYFSQSQLNELKHFAENVSTAAAAKFTRLYRSDYDVTTESVSEHFADEFLRHTSNGEQPDHYLLFGPRPLRQEAQVGRGGAGPATSPQAKANASAEPQPSGCVGIPHQTAVAWATQSLGEAKPDEAPARSLSQLEKSLLLDIASLFVEALCESYDGYDFHAIGDIVTGQLPLDLESTKELCKITFNAKQAGSQAPAQAYLLMPCDKLLPVTRTVTKTRQNLSAEDVLKAIIGRFHRMRVSLTTQLGSGTLTFAELMNLSINDILILDTRVNEPVKLIVEGLQLFRGQLAKSAGKYAVVIAEPAATVARATAGVAGATLANAR